MFNSASEAIAMLGRETLCEELLHSKEDTEHVYFTCPICRVAMPTHARGIYGHLGNHAKVHDIPRGIIGTIGVMLANKKGCNAALASLTEEQQAYVRQFVATTREITGGRF